MKRAPFFGGMASSALGLALVLLSSLLPAVDAQRYIRDWTVQVVNGVSTLQWQPTVNDPLTEVVDPSPFIVYLEYNCYYMEAICQNALKYLVSAGNANRPWPDAFAYDFLNTRKNRRRDGESCPSNWINSHSCPEVDGVPPGNLGQPFSYRYVAATASGGFWPNIELEPTQGNLRELAARRDPQGNLLEEAHIYYTCDEWPPASWIQGGTGAYTRCAPMRCQNVGGYASAQNFQADSHNQLRDVMLANVQSTLASRGIAFDSARHVGLLRFRTTNQANGVPAKIIVVETGQAVPIEHEVPFIKRRVHDTMPRANMSQIQFMNWASSLTMEEIRHLKMGLKTHDVHMNLSVAAMPDLGSTPQWGPEFEDLGAVQDTGIFGASGPSRSSRRAHGGIAPVVDNTTLSNPVVRDTSRMPRARGASSPVTQAMALHRRLLLAVNGTDATTTPLIKNATLSDLERARQVVEDALAESAKRNAARLANPARNQYGLAPGTVVGGRRKVRRRDGEADVPPPPLLEITPEIAAAAALVAEADAVELAGNATKAAPVEKRAGAFWMESIARKGTSPWGGDPSFKIFRNVKDYGAKGDGTTDDTKAIIKALEDGKRCGKACNGLTTKNAIIYLPPGTYLVSTVLALPFGTQLIGDANNWPTIKAARRFIGLGVLSTNEYTGGGTGIDGLDQQYYVNTANFYRQIRNLRIDITDTRAVQELACIHYQIAQATSLQFVELIAKPGTTQRGIFAENGSGGSISDITFKGGKFGLYGGNQQFTAQRLTFDGCDTAVSVIWDWGWIWKSITVKNVGVGFRLLQEDKTSGSKSKRQKNNAKGNIGSASFIDSTFSGVETAVLIAPLKSEPGSGSTGLMLENVKFESVGKGVADTAGKTLLTGGSKRVENWATGPIYSPKREFSMGADAPKYKREVSLLDGEGAYFERPKPQYESNAASDFVHLKDLGAKGDGVTDDSAAVQAALNANVGKLIFVDAGVYILTTTITIPEGTKLVGEAWSQFAARGSYFSDASNPKVMLKVGNVGDVGSMEMQDLIFTTQGPTAGAILVEWNIQAKSAGSAGLWECHVRIGGATGTKLNPAECPPVTSGVNSNCAAASLMMHITPKGSGYFENMWLWVADHLIDDLDLVDANNTMTQTSVYVARGFLIESQKATWLYSTASEHAVYYQYNFNKARNIFAGMVQTESPYYQPNPKPPAPFAKAVGRFPGDPDYSCKGGDFDGCDSSWAVLIRGSRNIFFAGAGLYSWFDTYSQDCISKHACQKALLLLENNGGGIRIQHLITIGAKYSWVQDGKGVLATDNLNVATHPRWSQITVLDLSGKLVDHISPDSATIIPLPHTTVPAKSTLTLSKPVATDIPPLPYDGDQNSPKGPGRGQCTVCSFFRLITSTCCGTGGSIGNPIEIPSGVATPRDIELPAGFVPNQPITGKDGKTYPADKKLPEEVIIPQGTVFPKPFVIPAGQPLRGGEDGDDDQEGDMVWIDPKIWDSPNPVVVCSDFPCTLQFPPWTSATSSLDYPLITVTSGTWRSTITRKPITISEWVFEPVTITPPPGWKPTPTGSTSTTSSTTDILVIIPIPPFRATPTWPWVTYTGPDGKPTPTRPPKPPPRPPVIDPTRNPNPDPNDPDPNDPDPNDPDPNNPDPNDPDPNNPDPNDPDPNNPDPNDPDPNNPDPNNPDPNNPTPKPTPKPPPPPPTGKWPTPPITIKPGPTPSPTVRPCAFPAFQCPGKNPDPDGPGGGGDPEEDEPDEPEDKTAICMSDTTKLNDPKTTTKPTSTTTTTSKKPDPTPEKPKLNRPDASKNEKHCYGSGQWTSNDRMQNGAISYCKDLNSSYEGMMLQPKFFNEGRKAFPYKTSEFAAIEIVMSVEVYDGCEWAFTYDECIRYMKVGIDSCSCGGKDGKRGGYVWNNCLKVRIDPNSDL